MGFFTVPREEIEHCVQLLGQIGQGKDADDVLDRIRPTILKLRNGQVIFTQIQKLVLAENAERAIKLLRVAPRTRGKMFKLSGLVSPIAIAVAVLFGTAFMPKCDGAYDPAMAALNSCPAAVALLGNGIEQSPVGMACGSSESSGSHGRANWKIPVKGDRGSGSYEYGGRNVGQGWRLDYARLHVGDQVVNVWPCAGGVVTPQAQALTMAVSMTGAVVSATGAAAVQPNTPCTITVSPTPPEAVQRGFNCHVRVQCGNAIIYGWEGAGFTSCQVTAGRPMTAYDPQGASAGDDPMLSLDVNNRTCTVSDDGQQTFSVVMSITGGV